MIRRVSFGKAVLAGVVGALAWEAIARALIVAGLGIGDIVRMLGAVAVPQGPAWAGWTAGVLLHMLVGALWAVFYAYFFWTLLPLRPTLQGLAFALVPMPLALFVMVPQLELMAPPATPQRLAAAVPPTPGAGLLGALGIVGGHLVWGLLLGGLYTRPVGHPVARPPRPARRAQRRADPAAAALPGRREHRFLFATGIECSYPTLEGGRWRMDQMEAAGHYRHWRTDLERVRETGLRYLRYGPPLHLIHQGPGRYDWSFADEVCARMRALDIVPIIDLCHFGLPGWLGDFQNPEVPVALADYARAFARRYPWVQLYTPVNEMYVCARLSALEGLWNEQRRDERSFVTAVRHLAGASVSMTQALSAERPDAIFVNSESGEFFQPCCPDPRVQAVADFENERRFLPLDLLYARPVRDDVHAYLLENGMPPDEYRRFMHQDARRRAILGVDYYDWNEKLIDVDGRPRSLGELFGWYVIASQYFARYRRPLMHTETNRLDAREGPRWLWRQWHNVQLLRAGGVPVVGFTWYSLTDQVDWDIAQARPLGHVNPVGLFDLNRDLRPVGQAYRHLVQLFGPQLDRSPPIDALLGTVGRATTAAARAHDA